MRQNRHWAVASGARQAGRKSERCTTGQKQRWLQAGSVQQANLQGVCAKRVRIGPAIAEPEAKLVYRADNRNAGSVPAALHLDGELLRFYPGLLVRETAPDRRSLGMGDLLRRQETARPEQDRAVRSSGPRQLHGANLLRLHRHSRRLRPPNAKLAGHAVRPVA